jgi:hypothetical protein
MGGVKNQHWLPVTVGSIIGGVCLRQYSSHFETCINNHDVGRTALLAFLEESWDCLYGLESLGRLGMGKFERLWNIEVFSRSTYCNECSAQKISIPNI